MKIRTLIVDDEPLAREWVRNGLQNEPELEVIGECGDGFDAVKMIAAERPDLVLLDVQMPGLDGFGVLASVDAENLPAVVFVTAFDRYALKAFEAHAVDYLMKPFSPERLHDAETLAAALKALPLALAAPRPIAEAISSAGGVRLEALDERLMLRAAPGVACAGEMLDWEAPTGGYLLTACLATGHAAGRGALAWLAGR